MTLFRDDDDDEPHAIAKREREKREEGEEGGEGERGGEMRESVTRSFVDGSDTPKEVLLWSTLEGDIVTCCDDVNGNSANGRIMYSIPRIQNLKSFQFFIPNHFPVGITDPNERSVPIQRIEMLNQGSVEGGKD